LAFSFRCSYIVIILHYRLSKKEKKSNIYTTLSSCKKKGDIRKYSLSAQLCRRDIRRIKQKLQRLVSHIYGWVGKVLKGGMGIEKQGTKQGTSLRLSLLNSESLHNNISYTHPKIRRMWDKSKKRI
jgi:hypothetical protein